MNLLLLPFTVEKVIQNIEEYLEKYVTELEDLFHNGYKYEGNNYEVIIRNYILDASARAFIN